MQLCGGMSRHHHREIADVDFTLMSCNVTTEYLACELLSSKHVNRI